jgi:exopolyphosphatase / guanosine-5'-triphosphate,3'-diphosphate pyrophosphatase
MHPARRAVIDVGTNSVKLLVAEVEGRVVRPVLEQGNQTRLGEGFYRSHRLQAKAIARTARAVAEYATLAREHGVQTARVIATSAARDAVNPHDLVEAVEKESHLKVEIIPGEQEAEWGYQGVTTDPAFAGQRLFIMDAGGGSTEFTLGQGEHLSFQRSFRIGAVRLLESLTPDDPPAPDQLEKVRHWLGEYIDLHLKPALGPALELGQTDTRLVGTGGTATILARMEIGLEDYNRERIEATRLSGERVSYWVDRLWSLPLAERRRLPGLPPPRADVMLMGAAIYEAVMRQLGFRELRISTRGLRFAAVAQPASVNTRLNP